MADEFFDREAELSDGSEDEGVRTDMKNKKRTRFEDSDEEEEDGIPLLIVICLHFIYSLFELRRGET